MPQVTVYVRKEDYAKWKRIENKAMFIRKALMDLLPHGTRQEPVKGRKRYYVKKSEALSVGQKKLDELLAIAKAEDKSVPQPTEKLEIEIGSEPELPQLELLKCCKAAAPCQHWVYDGDNFRWINTRTGERRIPAV